MIKQNTSSTHSLQSCAVCNVTWKEAPSDLLDMPLKWDLLQSVNTCLVLGFTLTSSLISSSVNIIPGPFFCRYAHSSSLPLYTSHLLTSLFFTPPLFLAAKVAISSVLQQLHLPVNSIICKHEKIPSQTFQPI